MYVPPESITSLMDKWLSKITPNEEWTTLIFGEKAIGKESVRKKGKIWFNPQELEKKRHRDLAWYQWRNPPLKGAIEVKFLLGIEPPKSTSKKKRSELIGSPHQSKPDVDNCMKFYLDCLKEIVFEDDAKVYKISCEKFWDEDDYVLIMVSNESV